MASFFLLIAISTAFVSISGPAVFASETQMSSPENFRILVEEFAKKFKELKIPETQYDYHRYFSKILSMDDLNRQKIFFEKYQKEVSPYSATHLNSDERIELSHLRYLIAFNLDRVNLEIEWANNGRKIPENGLYSLPHHDAWVKLFIKKYTSTDMTPEQVFELGKSEVKRVNGEINRIEKELGFKSNKIFYEHLQNEEFQAKDKAMLIVEFKKIDQKVRKSLSTFIGDTSVAPIEMEEWPNSDAHTPPGIYRSSVETHSDHDVFQFNFYGAKFNRRNLEWLYLHEAIPGHHLQSSFFQKIKHHSELINSFGYPGNFEGWACYVEYFGKELGFYQDPYSELGKWQWDQVRSIRLVLDMGINFYGWSKDRALQYWKTNITGQDDLAEREILRVTNWTGQALSYKVGADFIFKLKSKWLKMHPLETEKSFNRKFLETDMLPLSVIEESFSI